MKILLVATAFSGLCQRVQRELILLGHTLEEHYNLEPEFLREQVQRFQPDLILCPYLTQRIPDDIWQNNLCLVVHPGVEGDRGPSSLDWAISEKAPAWGVTLLQADAEMDMGDIWGTCEFPLRQASKTSVYKREVTQATIALILQTLGAIARGEHVSRALDYAKPHVRGQLRPFMKQLERRLDWQQDTTETVMQKLFAADTNPGVLSQVNGHDVYFFGPRDEPQAQGAPGELLAIQHGAACFATKDGAVWIRQMKCKSHPSLPPIKLPASVVLQKLLKPGQFQQRVLSSSVPDDIRVERRGDIAYLYFNFYNGAMSTEQCQSLKSRLLAVKQSDAKCIVFMGGDDFWSNGIHLNCIEAAESPAHESWLNINAIDDVVYEMINCPNQLTVAALRNNAGAGGAIMALACDAVLARDGVVLNPHYQSMGLYGSEYWTYLLPKRCGRELAEQITSECKPMLAKEALDLGLIDALLPENWQAYHAQLEHDCERMVQDTDWTVFAVHKGKARAQAEANKPLQAYRNEELAHMKRCFDNPAAAYHRLRHNFVYKIPCQRCAPSLAPAERMTGTGTQ